MRLSRSIAAFQKRLEQDAPINGSASRQIVGVTIGNFDGFHLGHQKLFTTLDQKISSIAADEGGVPLRVLLTFWPHPRKVLGRISRQDWLNAEDGKSLLSLRDKATLATQFGFDHFVALRFTKSFADISPTEFAEHILVTGLRARCVVVGHDWRFGMGRAGNTQLLKRLGETYGFQTEIVEDFMQDGKSVRSSLVRSALKDADFRTVRSLLGRPFSISARVVRGEQRGRLLGFPTANLHVPGRALPPDGVYAVRILCGGADYDAVLNIGLRPTFAGERRTVEAHILDTQELSLYRKRLEVEFLQRLRSEVRFQSAEELKRQIVEDISSAKRVFKEIVQ